MSQSKNIKNKTSFLKEYTKMLEQHNLPISRMGDIDWYLRQKYNCDAQETD